jgi:hypothetical protein
VVIAEVKKTLLLQILKSQRLQKTALVIFPGGSIIYGNY